MLYNYQRQLMICAGLLGNVHLRIQLRTISNHQIHFVNFYFPAITLHQIGSNHTHEDHSDRDDQPKSLGQLTLFHVVISFSSFCL